MEEKFIPSPQQEKVIETVRKGVKNIIVNAKAGSGKTKTIVAALDVIDKSKKVMFVAFNKSIVNALVGKLGESTDRRLICTYHSLGYRLLTRYLKDNDLLAPDGQLRLNELKYKAYITRNIEDLCDERFQTLSDFQRHRFINNTTELVDYARYNLMQSEKEMERMVRKYGINPVANECSAAVQVLKWGQSEMDEFDYTDLIWLPVEMMMASSWYKFDVVFIDEAQDSSPCQQSLFQMCTKSSGKCIMVGDSRQCINGWCGSDVQAFETLKEIPNTEQLDLSVSFRCPKKVIELARRIVPDIEYHKDAIDGVVRENVSISEIRPGDAVLCRTTEPLVRMHMKLLEEGKKSFIVGRTYGRSLLNEALSTGKTEINKDLRNVGVISELYRNLILDVKNKAREKQVDIETICCQQDVINRIDQINAIKVISSGINDSRELAGRIREMFVSDDREQGTGIDDKRLLNTSDNIILSTIHKAKGLEFDRVFLACKSIIPSPMATSEEEKLEELNLAYVAITRSRNEFLILSEDELRPTNIWNSTLGAYEELKCVKGRLSELYEDNSLDFEDNLNILEAKSEERLPEVSKEVPKIIAVGNKRNIKFKNPFRK